MAPSQMLKQLELLRKKMEEESPGGDAAEPADPGALLENCGRALRDRNLSPRARAEFLIYSTREIGLDVVRVAEELIREADGARENAADSDEERRRAVLQPEVFFRTIELGGDRAHVVLTPHGPRVLPAHEDEELPELVPGDRVLVDSASARIVGLDGVVPPTGEVATLESLVDDEGGVATVRRRDETIAAVVASRLRADPRLAPGASVILDAARAVVLGVIVREPEPSELLAPVESLTGSVADLGAPSPVIEEIIAALRDEIDHPDWSERLGRRQRRSFLFHGPTGTGKSTAIRAIAGDYVRWIEERTGARVSRVVFCDATRFHSPWFGEGERRVRTFFDQVHRLAEETHPLDDGRSVRFPVIVVLEELDGLVRRRGESAGGHLHDRILSLILQQVDGAERDPDRPIVFIATTNTIELLDAAAKRRFGERIVEFGHLDARSALAVLEALVPETLPIAAAEGTTPGTARRALLRRTIHHLHLADDRTIAEVMRRDGTRVAIGRDDVVSAALLEAAVSRAKDRSLARSRRAGALLPVETDDVIEALDAQLDALARSLTPENLPEQLPSLFSTGSRPIASVGPVTPRPSGHGTLL